MCEVTTAVSEFDAEYYRSIADDTSRIHVFSNVIDLDEYSSIPDKPEDFKNPSIFLAGSYGANSAMNMAANWILDEVLPIVRRSCPNIHFYIVGKRSDIEFGHQRSDSVTVTGMVDTVLPYLCHTNVALVPLMFESGTRFKILEAGACKTPIISTTLGAEGIPVIHDKEVLIADKAINFAKEIVNVLNDSELSNKLTKNCYDLISRKYSLTVLEQEAKKILEYLKMFEEIKHDDITMALILSADHSAEGIQFLTPNEFSQQLGYMNRPKGYVIPPHVHNPVKRSVHFTKEVLFIKNGKVRVDFYDDEQNYLESRILLKGDVILLAFGGHGFEMLESSEIIEVKQGPYAGDADKTRFNPVSTKFINIKE